MSIHVRSALKGIVGQAVHDANCESKSTIKTEDYRLFAEGCVAAETAELRREIAELKLANLELRNENNLIKAFKP